MNAPRSSRSWSLIVIRDLMFGNRRHFRELPSPSRRQSLFDKQD